MLLFMDGFDHYATADITKKWTSATGGAISAAAGRRGGGALLITSNDRVTKGYANTVTIIAGFAYKTTSLDCAIMALRDAGTHQVGLRVTAAGAIEASRGDPAGSYVILGTSANGLIATGTFYYIELKAKISDAVGTIDLQLNGVSILSLGGLDTKVSGNVYANELVLYGNGGETRTYDDLYICDDTGANNNTFLGDCRIDAIYPNGNGNSSVLVNSAATSVNNYTYVDEAAPDGDASYVESATPGDKDTYAFSDIAHTPSIIKGIQILLCAEKTDAGARTITAVTRSGGVDYDGAAVAPSTGYLYLSQIREVDPATAAAFTKANLNAAEFGAKIVT